MRLSVGLQMLSILRKMFPSEKCNEMPDANKDVVT